MQFFQKNIKVVSPDVVSDFVKKNQDFPLTNSLTQSYLKELTNRQDWNSIISFPKDNSIPSNCRYQYALLKKKVDESVFKDVETLWMTGKDLDRKSVV